MKKIVYLAAVAALGLAAGCTKEASDIAPETGATFSITVSTPATKTVFDGATYDVAWADDDELGAYIVGGDKAGVYKFTKDSGKDNSFSTTDFTPVEGVEYTYYVLYPYDAEFTVTEGKSNAVVKISDSGAQSDFNAAGHIATPLYGTATAEGTAAPEIKLNHAASVMKINVANYSGAELAISKVGLLSIDESAVMAGTFSIDFATGELTASEVSNEAAVTLETKTLANEASADFYVAVAPFAAENLSVTVNDDEFKKDVVENGFDFKAGFVYSTSVAYDAISLSQTVEDANVYAALEELAVGEVNITASIDGTTYYLIPEDGAFKDGEAVYVTRSETAGNNWTLTAADTYRIVYNATDNTVTIYSSGHEFNQPKTVEFNYGDKNGWLLKKTLVQGTYFINGMLGWDSWKGKAYTFTTSLADPQILISEESITIPVEKNTVQFCIKTGQSLADGYSVVEETGGENPTGISGTTFVSKTLAFVPADGNMSPIKAGQWMDMKCIVSNDKWTSEDGNALTLTKIIIDIRNNRIKFETK